MGEHLRKPTNSCLLLKEEVISVVEMLGHRSVSLNVQLLIKWDQMHCSYKESTHLMRDQFLRKSLLNGSHVHILTKLLFSREMKKILI